MSLLDGLFGIHVIVNFRSAIFIVFVYTRVLREHDVVAGVTPSFILVARHKLFDRRPSLRGNFASSFLKVNSISDLLVNSRIINESLSGSGCLSCSCASDLGALCNLNRVLLSSRVGDAFEDLSQDCLLVEIFVFNSLFSNSGHAFLGRADKVSMLGVFRSHTSLNGRRL